MIASPALAEDTVGKRNAMAAQLHDKIDNQATGEIRTKANAFRERMKDARANRKFIQAGSAGLDVMIELDSTPS